MIKFHLEYYIEEVICRTKKEDFKLFEGLYDVRGIKHREFITRTLIKSSLIWLQRRIRK
jgi:hypothetical protein